ncbi:mechanosensitive ion channel [Capnocytophaga canimorsus]|nr:mechanosensitive ion channel domain-containing protein [Capnocytophaga canimorsus]WGU69107.1 mechanosensitive ion channel [Capnocytophaga canimorsus]
MVIKYMNMFITLFACVLLITIWGVEGERALLVISSIFTVIGVAMFAQWSILSNITAGIILFFSFPFKIGNRIQIMDKEYPIEAEIVDIKSFYTLLKTKDEELICYPNNLLLQKRNCYYG